MSAKPTGPGPAPAVPVECCGGTAYLRPGQTWQCPTCHTIYQPPDRTVYGLGQVGSTGPEPFSPADPQSWPMDARQLDALLAEVADARRRATVAYAEAFLAAEGTQLAREATAQLAAAGPRCELETLEGRAEAFRMVLGSARLTVAREATAALVNRSRA